MTLSAYRDKIPDDLPPAPRYVLHMLLLEGPMTLDELRQYTQLPTSTLTSALDRLRQEDLIYKDENERTPLKPRYCVTI